MKRLSTKEQAKLFADGYQKGYEAGTAQEVNANAKIRRQLAYARKRVAYLATWRRFAIDRFGLGPQNVAEADRAAKK
jgi:hypothetical protein